MLHSPRAPLTWSRPMVPHTSPHFAKLAPLLKSAAKAAALTALTTTALLTLPGCASAQPGPTALGAEQSASAARPVGPGVCAPAPIADLKDCTLITGDLVIEN